MSGSQIFTPPPELRQPAPRWWPTLVATLFVLGALLALALIPLWTSTRIESLRTEIEVVAQPTHPLATRFQYMIARQAASIRGFVSHGDTVALQRYRDARAHDQEILHQLRPLTDRLDPSLAPRLERIERTSRAWQALADSLAGGAIGAERYRAAFPQQVALYRTVIDSSEALNAALVAETERRRQEIIRIERRYFRLTVLLALAGLTAAVLVWWLSRRERRFAERNRELARSRAEAEQRWRFLAEASNVVSATLDHAAMLRDLAALIVRRIATWCVIDVFSAGDGRRGADLVSVAHEDPGKEHALREMRRLNPLRIESMQPSAEALRTGEPLVISDLDRDQLRRRTSDPEQLRTLEELGAASLVAAPMIARGTTIGAITIVSATNERRYHADDLGFVMALVGRAALAVDNARLYQEASAASRAKSDFLAVMSHELRTPLTAVIGYADLMELHIEGPLTEGQARQLRSIKISAWHLLDILDEILSFARVEAGREDVHIAPVRLHDLVEGVSAVIRPMVLKKKLAFSATPPAEDIRLETDAAKVRRVLLKLLENAVNYTEQGDVALDTAISAEAVTFTVRDSGIGIAPEHLEHIFDPFWQAAPATTRSVGGIGLGLSVARRIAELLGGTVTAASNPGGGSTFQLVLPRRS